MTNSQSTNPGIDRAQKMGMLETQGAFADAAGVSEPAEYLLKPFRIQARFVFAPGKADTSDGPVRVIPGDVVCTNARGRTFILTREDFLDNYVPVSG